MLKTRTMSVSRMQGKSDKVVTVCLLYKSFFFFGHCCGHKVVVLVVASTSPTPRKHPVRLVHDLSNVPLSPN